jgi:membrane-associated phospholipid phosphatase
MRISSFLTFFVVISFISPAFGQKTDTLVKKLDSLQKVEEKQKPEIKPIVDVNKDEYTSRTNITFKGYFDLLGTDMFQEVRSPLHASKKTWLIVGGFAAVEGIIYFVGDKPIQQSTNKLMNDNRGLQNVSQYVTDFGALYEIYTLAAFGAYGIIFKSDKVKTTTLLATQAYITAGAMSEIVKYLTSRQRPNNNNGPTNPNNPNFNNPNNPPENNIFLGPSIFNKSAGGFNSSFPSGHTTAAFSAATVFAYEYKNEILIPVIAYSAASLVGISRITQNAHWTTDVIAGAALGYITGKQVVNNYHRYARLRTGKKVGFTFHFDLQYANGIIMPGMVCKF